MFFRFIVSLLFVTQIIHILNDLFFLALYFAYNLTTTAFFLASSPSVIP